jgi:soluble lytic murein transglycosylase-like protein
MPTLFADRYRNFADLLRSVPLRARAGLSAAATYLPSGNVPKLAFLFVMTAGLLSQPHPGKIQTSRPLHIVSRVAVAPKHVVARHIVAAIVRVAPVAPSEFDKEAAMTPGALMNRWDPLITDAARRFGVSQAWIRAVMRMESGGRTMLEENMPITSDKGAMGIMQLMPETYAEMRAQFRLGANPYDPHDNVFAGAAYLRWLYLKYGFPAMFAAYNAGPGELDDHLQNGRDLPAETRAYIGGVASILAGGGRHGTALARLTRPDGAPIMIDVAAVQSIRRPLPGEYADSVQSVISVGRMRQGVRESVAAASAILRLHGGI